MTDWIVALSAFGALCVSIWNMLKIKKLHILVNSRLTQLLEVTATAARAEGHLQGVVEGAAEPPRKP